MERRKKKEGKKRKSTIDGEDGSKRKRKLGRRNWRSRKGYDKVLRVDERWDEKGERDEQ